MGEEQLNNKGADNSAKEEQKEIDYIAENLKLIEEVKKLKTQNALLYQAVANGKLQAEDNKEEEKEDDYTDDILKYLKRNNRQI